MIILVFYNSSIYPLETKMHEFEVIKELGSGSFGRVLKVRRKDDLGFFAMKTIKMMQLTPK